MTRSVAYVVSRFPSVSQTFILNEILELEAQGWQVDLYPMIRETGRVTHPKAMKVVERANFRSVSSLKCLRAQLYWMRRRPITYLRMWALALKLPTPRVRFYPKAIWTTAWAVAISAEIDATAIRHIHAHWANYPAHAALVVSELTRRTFSFTAHAHDIYANAYGLRSKIAKAAFVATISDLNRRLLMESCDDPEKIVVVRCGIRMEDFPIQTRRRGVLPAVNVVAVGTLEEKKGHRYLVEACALLNARGRNISCKIIGDGGERDALECKINELGLKDSVILTGARDSGEVAVELANADVFVMPSVVAANRMMEGIPVALMEAMSTGLPVIASNISGIPELVEDGKSGILVRERDVEALASAIACIADDSDLRMRLGQAAREVVKAHYGLEKNVRDLAYKFEAIIAEDASTPGKLSRPVSAPCSNTQPE